MKFTAKRIAELLNGEVEGDTKEKVDNLSKIEEGKAGTLSFLANTKYEPYIYESKSSIIIVSKDFKPKHAVKATLIRVDDPYSSFAKLLDVYNTLKYDRKSKAKSAIVSKKAKIGNNVYIGDFVVIEEGVIIGDNAKIFPQTYIGLNSTIGEGSTLYMGVKIYPDTKIGNECIIHAGSIIGADGFGFAPQSSNDYKKVPQIGNVIIEDNVEVGANTTIDRATLGSTFIRKGVKLDNLIQIGHNVEIGENTVMAAQSGVSGSTKLGKNCMIGGQVGFGGHLTIGDGVMIGAQAGIAGNIKSNRTIMGSPAIDINNFQRSSIYFKKLPDIAKQIQALEQTISELKKQTIN
ncbi:MAG: UDP-3-O-(3-hydroxymyristoyl)glucosamine N-acyltransferase [Bacteroidota bacterium]|nr:UDP-3-O-(3-hydroxymyristoyl)glucosamine N-acyltransferase [Bacteroidota bacterium]